MLLMFFKKSKNPQVVDANDEALNNFFNARKIATKDGKSIFKTKKERLIRKRKRTRVCARVCTDCE